MSWYGLDWDDDIESLDSDELEESDILSLVIVLGKSSLLHMLETSLSVGTQDESLVIDSLISSHQDCIVDYLGILVWWCLIFMDDIIVIYKWFSTNNCNYTIDGYNLTKKRLLYHIIV